jgi:hypothetical protein
MPKWYRGNPGLVDEQTKQNRDDHADLERREFIREAAIEFAIALDDDGAQFDSHEQCWSRARALWDARPEDC